MALSSSDRRSASIRILAGALRRAPARIRRLSIAELELLVEAPVALPLAALALRRYGLRRLQAVLSRWPAKRPSPDDAASRAVEAQRLSWVVQVAAAWGPWPANCLQRSVVLWWFLHRRGIEGDMRIGVRRNPDNKAMEFHAWIEYGDVVINDRRDVRQQYTMFDRAIAPRDATFH